MQRRLTAILLFVFIIVLVTGCSLVKEKEFPQYALPAPIATDLTIVPVESPLVLPANFPKFQGLKWIDDIGNMNKEVAIEDAKLIHKVKIDDEDNEYLFVYYDDSKQDIINLHTGETILTLHPILPEVETIYGNEYGLTILYSNQIINNKVDVIIGNKYLMEYDITSQTFNSVYTFNNVVFGISSSPDNAYSAILVNSTDYVGTYADLFVLNDKGKVVREIKQFSNRNKSEGFVFPYDIEWIDNVTIKNSHFNGEHIYLTYDVKRNKSETTPFQILSKTDIDLLKQLKQIESEEDIYLELGYWYSYANDEGKYLISGFDIYQDSIYFDVNAHRLVTFPNSYVIGQLTNNQSVIWVSEKDNFPYYVQ